MLKQRVLTAIAMMVTFLIVLFLSPWYVFAIVTGLVFTVGAWEWAGLSGYLQWRSRLIYAFLSAAIGAALGFWLNWSVNSSELQWVLSIACAWWGVAFLWLQSYPASTVLWNRLPVRIIMGWLVIIPAWLATLFLRNAADGTLMVLLCLLIIAAADVGAYFSGKAFGRHKLAPTVSPGKSWEGVIGGMILAVFVGIGFSFTFGSGDWIPLLALIIPTALISVVGDLFESMIKRVRGIKDSGTILPGHGGVLDRVDGLVAATPMFALAILMSHWRL